MMLPEYGKDPPLDIQLVAPQMMTACIQAVTAFTRARRCTGLLGAILSVSFLDPLGELDDPRWWTSREQRRWWAI
jgi:hypothetical protein